MLSNMSLLTNKHQSQQKLRLRCNAGTVTITLARDLKGYGTVWYQPKGIANILSLARVNILYHVTYNIMRRDCFKVHKWNGDIRIFVESLRGLYWINIKDINGADRKTILNVDDKYNI